jgi:hypothetical protein
LAGLVIYTLLKAISLFALDRSNREMGTHDLKDRRCQQFPINPEVIYFNGKYEKVTPDVDGFSRKV